MSSMNNDCLLDILTVTITKYRCCVYRQEKFFPRRNEYLPSSPVVQVDDKKKTNNIKLSCWILKYHALWYV